jgi:hypothetical protein
MQKYMPEPTPRSKSKPKPKHGTLIVREESAPSRPYAKFTVTNDQFSQVQEASVGIAVALDPGLYSVDTLDSRGIKVSRLVRVEEGATSIVELREPKRMRTRLPRPTPAPAVEGILFRAGKESLLSVGIIAESAPAVLWKPHDTVELFAGYGWETAPATPSGWQLSPHLDLKDVPSARVRCGQALWTISLPLNPDGSGPARDCMVEQIATKANLAVPVSVTFGDGRPLANAIQGRLQHNTLYADTTILDEATELLYSKLADPAAAALGAITLHRLGKLEGRAQWVENLAEQFPWLADGRVLLAALLRDHSDPVQRDRGLEMLLTAARYRLLYADTLALALDLLRRWPDVKSDNKRSSAVELLGDLAAYTDWSSVVLANRDPHE